MYFNYIYFIYFTTPLRLSVYLVHTDAVLLKQQRMFVVGAKREQVC